MKQIICDICGCIIKKPYTKINFPSMFGGHIIQSHDEDDAYDVCKPCASELYDIIEKFKKEKR